jgi:DNA primase
MSATRGDVLGMLRTAVLPVGSDSAMAICPFHRKKDGSRERCPSMKVNFETRAFFCFACREEGDLDTLVNRVLKG